MSRRAAAGGSAGAAQREGKNPNPVMQALPVVAMKPRRGLFIALMTVLVIWVGFLVALYLMTVRPHSGKQPAAAPGTNRSSAVDVGPVSDHR